MAVYGETKSACLWQYMGKTYYVCFRQSEKIKICLFEAVYWENLFCLIKTGDHIPLIYGSIWGNHFLFLKLSMRKKICLLMAVYEKSKTCYMADSEGGTVKHALQ